MDILALEGPGVRLPLTKSISEQRIVLMARPIADMGKDRMRARERANATGEESERGVHQMGFEKPL